MKTKPGVTSSRLRTGIAALTLAATTGFVGLFSGTAFGEDRKPQIPDLKIEKYTLPNGLEVILHVDHTTPVAGVNLWYKVGSKNEKTGRTGFAHLFEHLMFQGSKNHDNEYFGPIEKVGAVINGSTNTDRTNYFETLPTTSMELALWLESDRMGFLLPALTQQKLDNQRDVVKNERRQRVDNVPYGQSAEKLDEALYPADHPYHHSVIGSMADLSAASLEDVSAFFRTYYSPSNASLCIAGDIDVPATKALVEKYFGPLPKGPAVEKLKPYVPALTEPKSIKMTDRVTLPMARLVWPTVQLGHEDEKALDVLAGILGQLPKENRLFRALMYDKQLAARVMASHQNQMLSGEFSVALFARPGGTLDELVKIADAQIERLKTEGPTEDEVQKVQNDTESSLIVGLQSAQRKSDFLNSNNVLFGDPLAYKKDMTDLFKVTAANVKRVANKYITANRVRLDVTPGPPTPRAPEVTVDAKSQAPLENPKLAEIKDSFDRSQMPKIGDAPKFTPPPVVRRKLSNGLEVIVAERHELPILSLSMVVKGGETLAPADKNGLAGLTASLLSEGTKTRDSLKLAGELAEIGATLNTSGELESSSVDLTTLTKHTDKALELYADVLLNPVFPEKELNRLKLQRLAALKARSDRPEAVAQLVFSRLVYGDKHPYGRPQGGTIATVGSITRDDVVGFHKGLFGPNNSALIVVGDTTPDAITATLEKALADWKPVEPIKDPLPEIAASTIKPGAIYLIDKPSAAQSVFSVGEVGLNRKTPDYFPLTVMNAALGGQFSSRINLNLREAKGYTYGARSAFQFLKGPGPFAATTSVQTAVTKEALFELMKELTDVTGPRPLTDDELAFAKNRLILGYPNRFETTNGLASALADLVLYDLPGDYFTTYASKVEAVDKAEANRVAKAHLTPSKMAVVVVGDKSKVESTLKTLDFAKEVILLDNEGNPAESSSASTSDR